MPWSTLFLPLVMAGFPLVQHGLAVGGATEAGKQQQRQEVGGGFDGWF